MVTLLYAIVASGYGALALWAWRAALPHPASTLATEGGVMFGESEPAARFGMGERIVLLLVWALHLLLLTTDIFAADGVRFGFGFALSAALWLVVAVFWFETLFFSIASMRLLILPAALLCALLPAWFPGSASLVAQNALHRPAFDAHLVVAMAAYGFFTIAALHALVMAALERWLHVRDTNEADDPAAMTRFQGVILAHLPPLMTMERLMFRLVGAGFVLLTLTVLTGVVFSEALFGQPLRVDQKTIFTLIAWVIFAALLAGRSVYGWRGRVALRWTLAGFAALFLAYVGSRFVLEVILHRF